MGAQRRAMAHPSIMRNRVSREDDNEYQAFTQRNPVS
jgi:hypothetical protein